MITQMLRHTRDLVLPDRSRNTRLRFGLARGRRANINFRYDMAYYLGKHEPVLWPYYRDYVKPGTRCFDVGMYRGWDALVFAHLSGEEVVSFDSNPESLAYTRKFLEPSEVQTQLVHAYVNQGQDGGLTLDAAAQRYGTPDFIKIDVEGAEEEVLRGAEGILTDRKPSLVIEVHALDIEERCIELLGEYGYACDVIDRPTGVMTERRSKPHNRWLACPGRPSSEDASGDTSGGASGGGG